MTVPARSLPLLLGLLACGGPVSAAATWSIVACEPDGSCGVAVSTHTLAVGAAVPAAQATGWAGSLQGEGFSVQGNGLAGPQVLEAMRARFLATPGALDVRLMAALEAGQAAGGQRIGAMSAALLVRTPQGGGADVDLRVDASHDPVRDLRALLDRRLAHQGMLRAERLLARGDRAAADHEVAAALAQSHDWDRLWRRAARLAMQQGERAVAIERLSVFQRLNPAWAREELRDPLYAALAEERRVAGWR
ncbi:hypothetical protein ARC20_08630 [Stenotrophomonas panacihumi]|uniref:DUF1028 domain-containing protein n=1 Tax=Stenotrophomonas panacihumi TaxID=676599 RepID=A0A0R0AP45_9GAMM|nr:DUF1028 domain-containing protein [Stenotrophomonas panacihumi]KRG44194.1 hypothetical protein ARC20_08630 [Stenotrophomonas panacihumi]PTN56247.1 DUF1028 domain-containing protein [Stenotrophomonas panacihumi]